MKFVFVSGGVVSGLGKGITTASTGLLLKARGIRVTNVKIDMYLNIDAGTIRPTEHGEVFVLQDGMECDEDLGHYERFLNESLRKENYMTTGQVYNSVIQRERAFGYEGEDVEAIPHVTDEIIERIIKAGKVNRAEVVVIELGGTVGEYQNGLFFEASRILKLQRPRDVVQVHVSYLPVIRSIGELKSKPVQQSVRVLNSMGIQPDLLVARSEIPIDQRRRERLALFCNMQDEDIITNPDLENIYEVPLWMEKQGYSERLMRKLFCKAECKKYQEINLRGWRGFVKRMAGRRGEVKIAMVGKYFATGSYILKDAYVCVIEALKHASAEVGIIPKIECLLAEDLEKKGAEEILKDYQGIIVPQGWGSRGVEGKILAVQYARENKVPYLGLCFGMQMAVIEFARNVLGMKGANSTEVEAKTKYSVIHIMPEQEEYLRKRQYGGTIRLGNWPCRLKKDSKLEKLYMVSSSRAKRGDPDGIASSQASRNDVIVNERHRHRYEFNNKYKEQFEKTGMKIAGVSPDGKLVEAIEIVDHPYFIGTQFHPEYISRPLSPHPLFIGFLEAVKKKVI